MLLKQNACQAMPAWNSGEVAGHMRGTGCQVGAAMPLGGASAVTVDGTSSSHVKVDEEGTTGSNIKKRPRKAAEMVALITPRHAV